MNRRQWLTQILLGAAVVLSGVVVVQTKHQNRTLVHELEQLRAEKSRLETEWAQLQLEEATLAHHGRIERVAREKLGMTEPAKVEVAPLGAGDAR